MNVVMIPFMIGTPQIILIIVVILLLFGGRKIPELMRGIGGGIKEFKNALHDDKEDDEENFRRRSNEISEETK